MIVREAEGAAWAGPRTGDLQPTRGEVKRHSHLSIGRYHQHSVDVLDESMRVLDFFMHTCASRATPSPDPTCRMQKPSPQLKVPPCLAQVP